MTEPVQNPSAGPGSQATGASQAGEAGLDLSLGHIGTEGEKGAASAWYAYCDACGYCQVEAVYEAAEVALGLDPPCPGCGRSAWSFHEL
jgi:hypothetical protein